MTDKPEFFVQCVQALKPHEPYHKIVMKIIVDVWKKNMDEKNSLYELKDKHLKGYHEFINNI